MAEEVKRVSLVSELEQLGEQIKELEKICPVVLDSKKWTILRVNGHSFRTFTKKFKSLYDLRMVQAMKLASCDWLREMNGTVVFVQSDEATVAIPPIDILPFNGRMTKIISLSAAFFSVRFNMYLPLEFQGTAHFDCRAFQTDLPGLYNVFRWRQLDAFRNGISVLARMIDKQAADKLTTSGKLKMINENPDVQKFKTDHIVHGTFLKKQLIQKEQATRTVIVSCILSDKFVIVSPKNTWLSSKYLTDEPKL